MFPKPTKGSGKAARKRRKQKLNEHRSLVNRFCLEADLFICQHCGDPAIHAHHVERRGRIDSFRESPDSRLSLCNDCHYRFESEGIISKAELVADLEIAVAKRTLDFEEWKKKQ